jgi:predicted ATPase
MRIAAITFENLKVFRKALLPLRSTTLIVGPNGSGKTTALQAIKYLAAGVRPNVHQMPPIKSLLSLGASIEQGISLDIRWDDGTMSGVVWKRPQNNPTFAATGNVARLGSIANARVYVFERDRIAAAAQLTPTPQLEESGQGLPAVLTSLQDQYPERFEALNKDLGTWLPEFDRLLLDTPANANRGFLLRTRRGGHRIHAQDLSQGTLYALALLSIAHLPHPPSIIALEDPDRGMHPRLLRDVLDATERLANPEAFGDSRPPVQVVMTTHSPLLVDLFKDRPEDVVLIEKTEHSSEFRRLSEIPNIEEILSGAHLGDAWFSGSLGGVPANT